MNKLNEEDQMVMSEDQMLEIEQSSLYSIQVDDFVQSEEEVDKLTDKIFGQSGTAASPSIA